MIEVKGEYAAAKIFTDVVDNESISQVINLLNQPYAANSKVRMMPDIHAGVGCTIGTTMTIKDMICPNLVGVDIGCGMLTVKLFDKSVDLEKLDRSIRQRVPYGFDVHTDEKTIVNNARRIIRQGTTLNELVCADHVNIDRAYASLGTLGGGNHFIEMDRDNEGNLYLVIHSGSRHLGLEIAKHYQNLAYKNIGYTKEDYDSVIRQLKEQGRESEISMFLGHMKRATSLARSIPKDMAYVTGALFDNYIHDMKIAQQFATVNRLAILDEIMWAMDFDPIDIFTTVHNYIDVENMILRKGAVSALEGERLIIPINMRDGSLICTGKGNPDWNFSAPHGAGRLMSRSAAKKAYTVDQFEAEMRDVYTTSVSYSTLDECPMAYKSMSDIVDNIGPTVTIGKVIKPIYNFKA